MTTTYSGREPDIFNDTGSGWVIENPAMPHRKPTADPFSAVVILNDATNTTIWPKYPMYSPRDAEAWIRGHLGIKTAEEVQAEKEDAVKVQELRELVVRGRYSDGRTPDWRNVARLVYYRLEDAEARIAELERKLVER